MPIGPNILLKNRKLMYKILAYNTDIHYPQIERKFLPGDLNDPRNEDNWQRAFEDVLECKFPNWIPSKSYYYKYYPRAKKMLRSRVYSGLDDRLVMEKILLEKVKKKLHLSPHVSFDNYIQYKESKIDVFNVFFNIDFLKSIDISASMFEFRDIKQSKKLVGLSETEFVEIYNFVAFGDREEKRVDKRHLILKKIVLKEKYDIFTLKPLSSQIILSENALDFFTEEGINILDPWALTFYEVLSK